MNALALCLGLLHPGFLAATRLQKLEKVIKTSHTVENRHLIFNADGISRFKTEPVARRFDGPLRLKAYAADRCRSMTALLGTKARLAPELAHIPGSLMKLIHPSSCLFPSHSVVYTLTLPRPGFEPAIFKFTMKEPGYVSLGPDGMRFFTNALDVWSLFPEVILIPRIEDIDFGKLRVHLQKHDFVPLLAHFHWALREMGQPARFPSGAIWTSKTKPYELRMPFHSLAESETALRTYHPSAFVHEKWTHKDLMLFLCHAVKLGPVGPLDLAKCINSEQVFRQLLPEASFWPVTQDAGDGWRRAVIVNSTKYAWGIEEHTSGVVTNDASGVNGRDRLPLLRLERTSRHDNVVVGALSYEDIAKYNPDVVAIRMVLPSTPYTAVLAPKISLTVQIPAHFTCEEKMENAALMALRGMASKPNAFDRLLLETAKAQFAQEAS